MSLKYMFLSMLFLLGFHLNAQEYSFTVFNDTYMDLNGSTSVNNGMTWDDPFFSVPVNIDFEYFSTPLQNIHIGDLGGFLISDTSINNLVSFFIPYGADLIDRGYDFNVDEPTVGSLSNISYLVEGNVGQRILKIEWNNVGFYTEFELDDISSDYANFQVWFFEGSYDIEIHFGPTEVNQPSLSYDEETGVPIALVENIYVETDSLIGALYVLSGDPANPVLENLTGTNDFFTFINGTIPEGIVYKFSKSMSGTNILSEVNSAIKLLPNPANDYLEVLNENSSVEIISYSIINNKGQKQQLNYLSDHMFDISNLIPGLYFCQLQTSQGQIVKKFVKQ